MALEPVAAEGRKAGGGAMGVSIVSAGDRIADLVDNNVVVNEVIESSKWGRASVVYEGDSAVMILLLLATAKIQISVHGT